MLYMSSLTAMQCYRTFNLIDNQISISGYIYILMDPQINSQDSI